MFVSFLGNHDETGDDGGRDSLDVYNVTKLVNVSRNKVSGIQ
jgi:hypothetical protein